MSRKLAWNVVGVLLLWLPAVSPAAALIDLFSINHTDEQTKLVVLDIPFFTLLDVRAGGGDFEAEFVDAPLITLYAQKREGETASLRVLDIPIIHLASHRRAGSESVKTEVLRLPLLGSVFTWEESAGKTNVEILFFIHIKR